MLDWGELRARANHDGEFRIQARFWNAAVRIGCGESSVRIDVRDGRITEIGSWFGALAADLTISASEDEWDALLAPLPRPFYQDLYAASMHHGFRVAGNIEHYCAYYPAIRRLVEIMRRVRNGLPAHAAGAPRAGARFDAAIGRYVHLTLEGIEHRIYFEEAGEGIPLLLQHTAGADGRQWRFVLEDPELRSAFRMLAYDLPYHGRSLPPTDTAWWERDYRLSRAFLMAVPLALAEALECREPVYMGSSIGGHLAIDLALHHPGRFRAVIGLETSAHSPGGYLDEFHHPRISNDHKASLMYGAMSPTSPEPLRRETAWVYSQGAPAVFKGDLYYYSVDHDVRTSAAGIDTGACSVDILNGEYDWSATPARGQALAAVIPGARYRTMKGLGHFPMSENPAAFLSEIKPVLRRIAAGARA